VYVISLLQAAAGFLTVRLCYPPTSPLETTSGEHAAWVGGAAQVKDEEGRLMNDFTGRVKREEWQPPAGLKRTLVVALDTAQYQLDMEAMQASGSEDVYSAFNLLLRRKPKARTRRRPGGAAQGGACGGSIGARVCRVAETNSSWTPGVSLVPSAGTVMAHGWAPLVRRAPLSCRGSSLYTA